MTGDREAHLDLSLLHLQLSNETRIHFSLTVDKIFSNKKGISNKTKLQKSEIEGMVYLLAVNMVSAKVSLKRLMLR